VSILLPASVGAQSTAARLSGTVWDPSDNPTPGVILTAVEESTGWESEAVSDENGRYVFLSLYPGFYTISTKARGYQQITRRHIFLPVNGNISESFTLDIATADETVKIEQAIPIDNSDSFSDISQRDLETLPTYSHNPLILAADIPGITANGGSESSSTSNGARRAMNSLRIDGLETTDPINTTLGSSAVSVSPDSLETIHVITSGAKAEFGGSAGAQLGAISRKGGKTWYGSIYENFSNKSLNANEYFRKISGLERTNFRRNIFGGTLSGPLWENRTQVFANYEGKRMGSGIWRNRLVLTDDSDDDDPDDDSDDDDIVYDDEARAGVFRWYTPGHEGNEDYLNSYYIVSNPGEINPQTAGILAMIPSPNNTLIGDGLNTAGYSFDNKIHNDSDQAAVRIDHMLNSKHRAFLRVNWSNNDATDIWNNADSPFPGTPEGTREYTSWSVAVGSHFILNPRMINELRIGYVRPKMEFTRPARSPQSMLLFNSWTNPLNPDYSSAYINPYFELTDNFIHHFDRHILKYGGTFRRTLQKSVDYAGLYPDISFGNGYGNAPSDIGPQGNSVISDEDRTTFEYLYNDMLGRIESISQTYYYDLTNFQSAGTPRERSFASFEFAGFVQDDWRVLPHLTLNLGLRYEFFSVPNEKDGLQLVLDPSSEISATGSYSDFSLVQGNNWRGRNFSNFAPRVGFAWDISGYGNFVLRGAYGIYYDRLPGAITHLIDRNTYGFSQTAETYPNLGGGDFRLGDEGIPYPSVPAEGPDLTPPATRSASIAVLDPNLKTPRVEKLNLTLERSLSNNLVLEISYIGTRGKNLYQNLNYNQVKTRDDFLQSFLELKAFRDNGTPVPESNTLLQIFGTPNDALEAIGTDDEGVSYVDSGQAGAAADVIDTNYFDQYAAAGVSEYYLRNYPQFDQFVIGTDTGRSWYNALQLGFRANSASFRMRAFYTWSKSLDTLSIDGIAFESPSDSFNPLANKAPSDFDRTHIINFSTSFHLPFGRDHRWGSESSRVMDLIFSDWELGVLSLWESGRRFSVSSDLQTLFANVESLANYSGKRSAGSLDYRSYGVYWFNVDEVGLFTTPEAGETGTSGRNSFKGPKYFNVDMAVFKHFRIGENKRIQVRAEIYNLFNRTHFGIPVTGLSRADFASFTSTIGVPRTVQISARFSF